MDNKKYYNRLLRLAEKDINALSGMINNEDNFDDSIFGFHAQQAVEKTIKALLDFKKVEFKKTHDLSELFNQVDSNQIYLPEEFLPLKELTDFAVEYRYDLMFDEDKINRIEIFDLINKLCDFTKTVLIENKY